MDEFELELKKGFLDEASQGIEEVEQCFLELEANPQDTGLVDKIFRLAHNLKGSSRAVGFLQLGEFTHVFENLLLKVKNKEITVDSRIVSLLLECNDHLKLFITSLKNDLKANVDSNQLLLDLNNAINCNATSSVDSEKTVSDDMSASVDPSLEYNQSIGEPKYAVVPNSSQFVEELTLNDKNNIQIEISEVPPMTTLSVEPISTFESTTRKLDTDIETKSVAKKIVKDQGTSSNIADESIRVNLSKLERLINYVGEMVILQGVLREQSAQAQSPLLRKSVHQLGRVSKEIQDLSMGLRMLPIKPIFQKMQRIVRDTSAALNKKINFIIEGEETAVDKSVLDQIGDPLVHLVRNAVDHGIETNERRAATGKTLEGTIVLKAFHRGDKLYIEVIDNGGGIDPKIISKKAIEKGIVTANHNLSEQEIVNLVFHPGFSTKSQTTEISGRGVGMDVVSTNISSLKGSIEIDTKVGEGSTFRIILPLTLAIVDGLVLESDKDFYIVPLSQVRDSIKPKANQIQVNKDLGETMICRGENIPLYRLNSMLNTFTKSKSITDSIVVIIRGTHKDFGIVVDDIINQQQVVIKKLGLELNYIKGFSGTAILGTGRPALILEPQDLVNYYLSKNPSLNFSYKEIA